VLQLQPDDACGGGPASPPPTSVPASIGDGLQTSGPQIRRPACSSHRSWQTAFTHAFTALTWS
jgi:hypothetical protein